MMEDKEWKKFLGWFYKAHQVSPVSYTPNKISIELWKEYEKCDLMKQTKC